MKTLLRKTFRGALAITILCLVTTAGAVSRGLEDNYGIIPMPYSIEARGGKPFQMNAETGGPGVPQGPVFMGPEWRELFKFAVSEADRSDNPSF